jgi:hypothetical protein
MPTLPDEHRAAIRSAIARKYSAFWTEIPISKDQFRALVNFIDTRLDAEETAIFQALPAGAGKDWLLANPAIGREIMTEVERKRMEVL